MLASRRVMMPCSLNSHCSLPWARNHCQPRPSAWKETDRHKPREMCVSVRCPTALAVFSWLPSVALTWPSLVRYCADTYAGQQHDNDNA